MTGINEVAKEIHENARALSLIHILTLPTTPYV